MAASGVQSRKLEGWDQGFHWTHKKSLQIPSVKQFIVAVFSRERGGFNFDQRRKELRKLSSPDFVVICALAVTYFCSVFSRVAVSVLAPELQVDPDLAYSEQQHGQVVIAIQISFLVGRLVNGFLIDMANPRYMFMGYLVGSAAVTLLMSFVHDIIPEKANRNNFILGCAATNALFQSGTWTAATKFIHDHYRPAQYGKTIVILSILAKLGSVGALLILSAVASSGNLFWYDAQRLASGVTLCGVLTLLVTFLYPHPASHLAAKTAEEHHENKLSYDAPAPSKEQVQPHGLKCSKDIMRHQLEFAKVAMIRWLGWWTKKQFVIVAIANASMSVVCSIEGLEAFLTLFFFNGFKVPSQIASQSAIVLPLGVAASLVFGGMVLERLDNPSKADAVIFMLLFAVLANVALLGVVAGAANALHAGTDTSGYLVGAIIFVFLIGLTMGYAFFVPISTFALIFGGENAALASSTLNVFSSIIGAAFSAAVGALAGTSWTAVIGVVLIFSVVSFVSMIIYYYNELVDKRVAIAEAKNVPVVQNLKELVLHKPHFEASSNNPVYDSSLFSEPAVHKESLGLLKEDEEYTKRPGKETESREDSETTASLEPKTVHARWRALREKYGPGMRPDANRKVSKGIAVLFTTFFVVFGFAMFISYFAARSNANFVFPFGDGVRFANRTV